MHTFSTIAELQAAVGTVVGTSDWTLITQDRINQFADATGDHQWIHVDPAKAANGPFGSTIAHGYLTLSMVPFLGAQVMQLATPGAMLNYGVNKVRFPNPVKVEAKIRAQVSVNEVTEIPAGHQVTFGYTIEIAGESKPACVAETVVLLLN